MRGLNDRAEGTLAEPLADLVVAHGAGAHLKGHVCKKISRKTERLAPRVKQDDDDDDDDKRYVSRGPPPPACHVSAV